MRSFSNCKSSSILRQVGLSFFNILEPTFIQAPTSHRTVKTFNKSIFRRLSGSSKINITNSCIQFKKILK
uniref:Uncharacterized protein n=1 Tax=Leptospira santarosai serovar Arenal str. MAVJ 401 TaxID=1049976 RepID=M6K712_9LEPT|nr:hypothetical protein LEP1GSC063_0978 [Leptospira santarosai serovar Arenal str. MAVJ 401]